MQNTKLPTDKEPSVKFKMVAISLAIVSAVAAVVFSQIRSAPAPSIVAAEPVAQPSQEPVSIPVTPATLSVVAAEPVTQPSQEPVSIPVTPPPDGFSFNPLDEPRALPEVPFMDGDGRALSLADFQGKLVLLNIWATWCVPCRVEMPALNRLEEQLGSSDFQVVTLSIDTEVELVKEFFEELELNALKIYIDETVRVPLTLKILGIPATLLLDRQGREIGRVIGPAEWDDEEVVATIRYYLGAPTAVQVTPG